MVSPIETMILNLREAGFPLVLLWMLTVAIVYGILSHVNVPKSYSARATISIICGFLVLFAAAATSAAIFLSTLIASFVAVAFGLMMLLIFLEIAGAKAGGKHVFEAYPKFFAAALIIIAIAIFVGAGGLKFINISWYISDATIALVFFLVIMAISLWVLTKEEKK